MKNIFEIPSIKYMALVPDANSEMVEVEKEVQGLKLFKLHRTNIAHSKFAFNLNRSAGSENDAVIDDAIQYAKICIVDNKLREEISKDPFACLVIFQSEEVQKDLMDFFSLISTQMGISTEKAETTQE